MISPEVLYNTASEILEKLQGDFESVMLFGSVARGCVAATSDIDVLQMVSKAHRSYRIGNLSASVYPVTALRKLAREGSLFVLHLKTEGKIIHDPNGTLAQCLESYQSPKDYSAFLRDLGLLARFLDVSRKDYTQRWHQLNELGVFILRSALYSQLAAQGRPTFAMQRVAELFQDKKILSAYRLKNAEVSDWKLFLVLRQLIKKYLQLEIHNPFGSFEALLLDSSNHSDFVKALALRLVKGCSGENSYTFFKSRLGWSSES